MINWVYEISVSEDNRGSLYYLIVALPKKNGYY